nr:proctolin peptide [Bombyx mori]
MTWILNKNSRKLQEMISAAKNESLPDNIEHLIKRQGSDDETGCIRLLVCKITPFIVRMQEAVFGNNGRNDKTKSKGNEQQRNGVASVMYRYLPTQDEINEHSDICERRHRDCSIE